ncbi:MAG: tyrosine-type recombinase/integrase [Leptospiraceae bacterium]|nr:tyrosine-type recombinase/integrase [Leptospiraceae bacterium]
MNLIEGLRNRYPNKIIKYISNKEIDEFLLELERKFTKNEFIKFKDYILIECKLHRSILLEWEKKVQTKNSPNPKTNHESKKETHTLFKSNELHELMNVRRYSPQTIKNYILSLERINRYFLEKKNLPLEKVKESDLKEYFLYITVSKKESSSSVRIKRFALEFYFREILHKTISLDFVKQVSKEESLPTIFSKDEIKKILDSTYNLKHRLMLALLYSSGLRLSEVIHLKVRDLDFSENLIRIKQGKGYKDRISVLSEKLIDDLKIISMNRKHSDILFPSNQQKIKGKDSYLSSRTVEKIFENCLLKSGIKKKGSPHSFRHSFATHLLESGTDIHFIQKLLGHKNLSTTSIYTKLANPKIAGVKSPL